MPASVYVAFCFLLCLHCQASHFRGGTISWKPVGNNTAEFRFRMGWTYQTGPGCNKTMIGRFVNESFIGDKVWTCTTGCQMKNRPVGTVFYFCSGFNTIGSPDERWEQGENTFQESFIGTGPYTVGYSGAMWMSLDFGQPNGWNVETTVDLRTRDDLNTPNSSPITASKPLYTLQFSCYHELQLPMFDPDGDIVKCRWAIGTECDSVCHAVPAADLGEDSCTLKFNASSGLGWVEDGWYAIALTFEDFPMKTIKIGNDIYNESTPMSTVPLQFLIHLVGKPTPCTFKPEFVTPTPEQGSTISIPAHKTFNQKIYAANLQNKNETITKLTLTGPAGMKFTGPTMDASRPDVFYWNLTWTPTLNDKGDNIVCCQAWDSSGHSSINRCFTVIAWDIQVDPCKSNPCRGQEQCVRIGSSQNIKCVCPTSYIMVGQVCQAITTPNTRAPTPAAMHSTKPVTTITQLTTTRPVASTTPLTTTNPPRFTTKTPLQTIPLNINTTPRPHFTTSGSKTTSSIYTSRGRASNSSLLRTNYLPKKLSTRATNRVPKHWYSTRNGGNFSRVTTDSFKNESIPSKKHINGMWKSGSCFSSKFFILFILFFLILILALIAIALALICKAKNMKKRIKELESLKNSCEIDTS